MIESQIFGRKFLSAVLTRVIVARVDVRARKLHPIVVLHTNVLQKTNDRRKFDGERNGMNLLIVLFDDFDFARENSVRAFFQEMICNGSYEAFNSRVACIAKADFSD